MQFLLPIDSFVDKSIDKITNKFLANSDEIFLYIKVGTRQ